MSFKYRFIVSFVLLEIFFIILIVSINFIAINNSSKKLTEEKIELSITFLEDLLKVPLSIYDLATIDDLAAKSAGLPYINSIIIADSQDRVVSKDYNFEFIKLDEFVDKKSDYKFEINNQYYDIRYKKIKQDELILGSIYLIFDVTENKQFIEKNKQKTILIILIEIFLSTILSYIIGSRLTMMLTRLSNVADDIGQNKDPEIPYKESKNEMGVLARSLSQMQLDLKSRNQKLKELAVTLHKQKKQLLEAHKSKDDFLANMSHELKTPLNSINVISAVMMKNRKNNLSEDQIKNLSVINKSGHDLLYLINDVLDISKLEAGEIILENEDLKVCDLVEEIKDMFQLQVEQKGLYFDVECDNSIGVIHSDAFRIKQILKNLLSNALKFTKEGVIGLYVKNLEDKVEFSVKDDGIGIPANKLEHIFDRFKQVDSSTTRKYGGTGLGLAICKQLSNLLGGDIKVESQDKKGAIFTVTVARNEDKISVKSLDNEFDEKKKIIILNNDPILFLNIVVELNRDYKVKQVSSCEDFEKAKTFDDYDLSIIDINEENYEKIEQFIKNDTILIQRYDLIIKEKDLNSCMKLFEKDFNKDKLITYVKDVL